MFKKIIAVLLTFCMLFTVIPICSISANALSEEEISAPSAILMDYETGKILFEKNSHDIRACASITKIMTLCLIFESIDSGKISYDNIVTTSPHAAAMGGSDIWLVEGEQMNVNDLIKAIVVASANDAAVAMAEYISGSEEAFVAQMNEKAKELGLNDTTFKNCNGLDEDGHLTSAYDVALMSRELMTHEDVYNYTSIWLDYLRDGATQIVNTNKLLKSYDGITGLKTGTTTQAGACISATAQRDGLNIIAVVLGAESTTDRFTDATTLLNYGFANYSCVTPKEPEESVSEVNVTKGMESSVLVKCDISGKFLMEKGAEESITSEIKVKEEVEAPVKQGQELGRIVYKSNDVVLGEYPIVAVSDVEQINFRGVFSILLNNFISV